LNVHFTGTGCRPNLKVDLLSVRVHGKIAGRVRYIAPSACWVGDWCFRPETKVEEDSSEPGEVYSVHIRGEVYV
jgi:hypothetical protein